MKNPSQLLPLRIGDFDIRPIKWTDFPGQIDQSLPWSAHIYWWIDYTITDPKKKRLITRLHLSQKSWVKSDKKCAHLLNHQQGHYLIGAMCSLQFMRRIDSKKKQYKGLFDDLVEQTFERTIKQYQDIQKKYDLQTQHRLNFNKQLQWDSYIYQKLIYYKQIYDKNKRKFVRFSQSPNKKKIKIK